MKEFEIVFSLHTESANGVFTATVRQFPIENEKTRYWVTLHDDILIHRFALHLDFYYSEDAHGKSKNFAEFQTNHDDEQAELCKAIMKEIEKHR